MKLSGNSRRGRHTGKNPAASAPKSKKSRLLKIIISAVMGLIVVISGTFAILKLGAKPPEITELPKPPNTVNNPKAPSDPNAPSEGDAPTVPVARTGGKYTFVVLGSDDGNGNTDVFMVATLDTANYTLNIVNIPRDTLVNVSWPTKKINSLFANLKIEGTIEKLADILGYEVDFYVLVDLKAFSKLVNAIGGVDFDVPQNMNYEDPSQNLYIHLTKGMQNLKGDKALQLVRFRSYSQADLKRIETQQSFLMAAARQILEKKNVGMVPSIVDIFVNDVKTDLTSFNLVWLADEMFKLDAENITFTTAPVSAYGNSYVTINVGDWLELLNSKLNPFDRPITKTDLSIFTRDGNGKLYVTDGAYAGSNASWGSGSSSGISSTPAPTPASSPTPPPTAPSETPDASASPTPDDGLSPPPTDVTVTPPEETEPPTPPPNDVWGDPGAIPTPTPTPPDTVPAEGTNPELE
ncbi:MAG: LCP family protein [Oscillospiraceae bacterium]|jgi:LCP family protein required for cell wall assembly|nr:LCP family protein [Oscillospiraceae bacterium]